MKKRIISILLCFCMIMSLLPVSTAFADAPLPTVSMVARIGADQLENGKYYTVSEGGTFGYVLTAFAEKPADSTDYLYFDNGKLTVTGNVTIKSNGPSSIYVNSGTLELGGTGNLTIEQDGHMPAIYSSKLSTASGYSGDVDIKSTGIAIDSSMIELNTTGRVSIFGKASSPVISTINDTKITGSSVEIRNLGGIGGLFYTPSGYETSLTIAATEGNIYLSAESVAPLKYTGTVNLSATGDITARNRMQAFGSDLNITQAKNVTLTSYTESVVTGTVNIKATGDVTISDTDTVTVSKSPLLTKGLTIAMAQNVTITGSTSAPVIWGNTSINASNNVKVENLSGGLVLNGDNVSVKSTAGAITIESVGAIPTIVAPLSLTLNAKANILIQRTNDAESNVGVIDSTTKTLTSTDGFVIINGSSEKSITRPDGSIVNAVYGGDITDTGVDLYELGVDKIPKKTLYNAGAGYMLYTPTDGTNPAIIELKNATINAVDKCETLVTLPNCAVTINVSGKNVMTNTNISFDPDNEDLIRDAFGFTSHSKFPTDLTIISSDKGSLDLTIQGSRTAAAFGNGDAILKSLIVSGNVSVIANALVLGNSDISSVGAYVAKNPEIGDDATFIVRGEATDLIVFGDGLSDIKNFNGALLYINREKFMYDFLVYGNQDLPGVFSMLSAGKTDIPLDEGSKKITITSSLKITKNSTLTIESGDTLKVNDISKLINEGIIVNNGAIILPFGTTAEDIKKLSLSGRGFVKVLTSAIDAPETYSAYSNAGVALTVVEVVEGTLPLGSTEVNQSDNKGYTWTPSGSSDSEVWTLKLDSALVEGALSIPDNLKVVITSNGDSVISDSLNLRAVEEYSHPCNITFTGTGSLTAGGISFGGAGGVMTVSGGFTLTNNNSVFIGASGGSDGTINVTGAGTSLNVYSPFGYAIDCDTFNVADGATVNAKAQGSDSIGVQAITGVNVTGGSTLKAGCDYGVYIDGGKLTVDENSKLITNGAIAPFCIIDASSSKTQDQVLSLPGIPEGTQIASVKGANIYSVIRTYWSLVPTGGSLGVSNEYNTPVTLSGAAIGLITFAKATSIITPSGNDGGSGISPNATSGAVNGISSDATSGAVIGISSDATSGAVIGISPVGSDTVGSNVENNDGSQPKTGDKTNVLKYILIATTASLLLTGVSYVAYRRKNLLKHKF